MTNQTAEAILEELRAIRALVQDMVDRDSDVLLKDIKRPD